MWHGDWPGLEAMKVFVISPSYPQEKELLDGAQKTLGEMFGLELLGVDHQPRPKGNFLSTLDERIASVKTALQDPAPALLLAARGGYGAYEVALALDRWLPENPPKSMKALMGYSDISALHLLWQKHGLGPSFMGPHSGGLARGEDPLSLAAIHHLKNPGPLSVEMEGQWLKALDGPVSGLTIGGNLTVLASTLGGPLWQNLPESLVLFLEDIDEEPYQLDRSLLALQGAGVLGKTVALVLGDFNNCEKPEGKFGPTFEEVFNYRLKPLGIPIFSTSHFGHGNHQGLVPLGVNGRLDPIKNGKTLFTTN